MSILLILLIVFLLTSCGTNIHDAASKGDLKKLKSLLEKDPDLINAKGRNGKEPLHWATEEGHKDVVEFLLTRGADVDCKNVINETPLHYAIGRGHREIVELLIANGADVNATTTECWSALEFAQLFERKEVAELLIRKGAHKFLPDLGIVSDSTLKFEQKLQKVLNEGIKVCSGKGVSAAVTKPNRKIWTGASGMSNPTKSEPITPKTLFNIGSINKFFIAALILQLVEEGKLNLEEPLSKWLPQFKHINSTITIRQLLNHTSGIYDFVKHPQYSLVRQNLDSVNLKKIWTPEEIISKSLDKPYFSPGKGWHYSTSNYVLLGMIIEKITKSKLSTELRNRFLNPLGLKSTFSAFYERVPDQFQIACNWYDYNFDGEPENLMKKPRTAIYTWAYHFMYSTPGDLAKWAKLFFQGKVVKESSMKEMLKFYSPTPGESLITGYGLGVCEGKLEGIRWWGHAGIGFGYQSIVVYLPDFNVIVAMMENIESTKTAEVIMFNLLKVILYHLNQT